MVSRTVSILALLAWPACGGDDGGEVQCETLCQQEFDSLEVDCEDACRSCNLACAGFGDTVCRTGCTEAWSDCILAASSQQTTCVEGCACWHEYRICNTGCDPGDTACEDGCFEAFLVCADYAADESCMMSCADDGGECKLECDTDYLDVDWSGWVNCTFDCRLAEIDCRYGCR